MAVVYGGAVSIFNTGVFLLHAGVFHGVRCDRVGGVVGPDGEGDPARKTGADLGPGQGHQRSLVDRGGPRDTVFAEPPGASLSHEFCDHLRVSFIMLLGLAGKLRVDQGAPRGDGADAPVLAGLRGSISQAGGEGPAVQPGDAGTRAGGAGGVVGIFLRGVRYGSDPYANFDGGVVRERQHGGGGAFGAVVRGAVRKEGKPGGGEDDHLDGDVCTRPGIGDPPGGF